MKSLTEFGNVAFKTISKNEKTSTAAFAREYYHSIFDNTDIYSLYCNLGTGLFTGVMDNERDVFYEFKKQEDIRKFINVINVKENHFTRFLQSIELELKQYIDREIEHFEIIQKQENELEFADKLIEDLGSEEMKRQWRGKE